MSQHLTEGGVFVGRSRRGTRKMGPSGLTEKRERYIQLMQQGHSNSAACRILEIHRNTCDRLLNGRKGVGAFGRQMLYPPRVMVPVRTISARYLSEDERVFIADRLLGRASLRSIAREPGRSTSTINRELTRNPPGTGRYHPFRAQKAALRRAARPRLPKLVADRELHDFCGRTTRPAMESSTGLPRHQRPVS